MAIEEVMDLDTISAQHSVIHDLEGRVKLIVALAIIVFCVFSDRLAGRLTMLFLINLI